MLQTSIRAKPILKWAGGKTQLLSAIARFYPFNTCGIKKYVEPFVGGGAVLFDILNRYKLQSVYISDINAELINLYTVCRDCIGPLIDSLHHLQTAYLPLSFKARKQVYLFNRTRFNTLKQVPDKANRIERAALLLFLNKTCFNGLYRVNRSGAFNVPIGRYKSPLICDIANLHAVHTLLQDVEIVCAPYTESLTYIDRDTFVYLDPPYRPLSATAGFTAYSEYEFGDRQQQQLADFIHTIHHCGSRFLLSNSDPKNIDPADMFFDNLYSHYHIMRIPATRMINSNAKKRGQINELLISNFAPYAIA